MFRLTEQGKRHIEHFIADCEALKKDILDAKKDTADDTTLPTAEDILADMKCWYVDGDEYYYSVWGITDNYSRDIALEYGTEFYREV